MPTAHRLVALSTAVAVAAALLTGTAPAVAAETPSLSVSATASASTAVAGGEVVFTVSVTNEGASTIDLTGLDEYDGPGASVGLWLPDPASCTEPVGGDGWGGSEDVCFASVPTGTGCNTASMGWPDGWTWGGSFSSTRPATLAPGASFTCTIAVKILRNLAPGSGIALEAWASPDGYEHFPGEHHADSSFTAVTVPGGGTTDGPRIAGSAAVGKTLTATRGFTGPWDESSTFRWLRNGTPISGATGMTYTPSAADVGARLSVAVTAQNSKGLSLTSARFTSPATPKIASGSFSSAPTPKISGTVRVGQKLTAVPGSWKPTAALSYQWYRGSTKISRATRSSYVLTAADRGATITVKITGKKAGYTSTTVTAAKTAKVAAGKLTAPTPKISGTVAVGKKLTAKPGTWTSGTSLSYRWYASGKPISGATKSTFTLKSAQKGKSITVKVTGKKSGYTAVTKASASTKKVA